MKKLMTLLLVLFTSLSFAQDAKEIFKIKTVNGKELTFTGTPGGLKISPYEGKVVFLEFWGTWCGPCLLSIPHHVAMKKKYRDTLEVIAIETTPSVTTAQLKKYADNPGSAIDMSKVQWYLDNKAQDPRAKAYLAKPLQDLKAFKKSNEKLNYDLVSSKDAGDFISYIAQRASWRGGIPFLIIFKPNGDVSDILQGMPTEASLQKAYNFAIGKIKTKKEKKPAKSKNE